MPLSKERNRQRKREERARLGWTQVGQHNPSTKDVQPKPDIPKLPWFAGASDHFGVVRNRRYAKDFFTTLLGAR